MPREKLPGGVVVNVNKKGWMNTDVMKTWADSCYRARPGVFFKPKSLLIFDAMTAHKEPTVQKHLNSIGAHIAVIPGGLTCKLQPLDVAVNHPFKTYIREEWDNWMVNGEHTYTPAGRQRRATFVQVCEWVIAAWDRIKPETIMNGFRKCGIWPITAPPSPTQDDDEASGEESNNQDDSDDDEPRDNTSDPTANDEQLAAFDEQLSTALNIFENSFDESFDGFNTEPEEAVSDS